MRMPAHPEQRLVDMGVSLDEAGQQHLPRAVDARGVGRHRRRVEGGDLAALQEHVVTALPPDEDVRDQDGWHSLAWLLLCRHGWRPLIVSNLWAILYTISSPETAWPAERPPLPATMSSLRC